MDFSFQQWNQVPQDLARSDHITSLSFSNFDQEVLSSSERWLVFFTSNVNCDHCVQIQPIVEKLAQNLDFQVGQVDVDDATNGSLVYRFDIQSHPAFFLFHPGTKSDSEAIKYNGSKNYKDLMSFAKSN